MTAVSLFSFIYRGDNLKYKKIISILLVFIWLTVIFNFSNTNTYKSNNTSKLVTYKIINTGLRVTNKLNITDVNTSIKALELSNRYNLYSRKCAHATIYFILGIFIYYLLTIFNKKNAYLISVIFCFMYAISDEIHQKFVMGRTSSFYDVLIDTIGCIFGLFIIYYIKKIRRCINEKN